jgi:DNA-binding NarL/FixJ family response regulator
MKRVIIVEDHDLYRSCLKKFVDSVPGYKVIAEAPCGILGMEAATKIPADLISLFEFAENRRHRYSKRNQKK